MDTSQKLVALLTFLLTTILFLGVAQTQSHWIVIYRDGFENFPANWSTDTRDYGSVAKDMLRKLDGAYSLRISTQYTTDNAYAYLQIPGSPIADSHIQIWFYVDYSNPPDHVYILETRDAKAHVNNRIVVDDEAGVCYVKQLLPGYGYDPRNYVKICQVTKNVWHKLDYYTQYAQANSTILIDDVNYGVYAAPYPTILFEYLYLGDSTVGGFKGLLYFDNLMIEQSR
jgi:hypothetical protein